MTSHLAVTVRLHEPRWHGLPEWPPAPARLFQALVAGAADRLAEPAVQAAFRWLEALEPPTVVAPRQIEGRSVTYFVPNNDLDAKGGDPERVPEIRAGKVVRPRFLQADVPFVYLWTFHDGAEHADRFTELAGGLYQFGRGDDMAWATAEVLDDAAVVSLLEGTRGVVHRPSAGASMGGLACPRRGTFDSLERRHARQANRFEVQRKGGTALRVFVQPPKAVFREVSYEGSASRFLYELRNAERMTGFAAVPPERSHDLIVALRDAATERLAAAMGDRETVEAVLVGRRPGEPERVATAQRVRIVPLPSIGHVHADPSVRRVVVEVPAGGPLGARDVQWAFSGLELPGFVLVAATDRGMLHRYASGSRVWATITPLALPAVRRRIDPERRAEEAKGAEERAREEAEAVAAVRQALRHAGVTEPVEAIRVHREPSRPGVPRAEAFAAPPRFPKERLWHAEIVFRRPVAGPLVLGDGRFLGLGVMAPLDRADRCRAWRVHGLEPGADPLDVAAALRRAVLARAQEAWGAGRRLPSWVTGHSADGSPATDHQHLSFLADLPRGRVLVVDGRGDARSDSRLEKALEELTEVRAGRAGLLTLDPLGVADDDPLVAPSHRWVTVTPYRVERHAKAENAALAVELDVRAGCRVRRLPEPVRVVVRDLRARPGEGLEAHVELEFAVPVAGPLVLGRTCHKGGGLFEAKLAEAGSGVGVA